MTIAHLRKDYSRALLLESDLHPDPVAQFSLWLNQAMAAELPEVNAMSVATVATDGRPSSRIVLLKEFNQDGFVWFTQYTSRKGQELQHNPYAALLFYWTELERQVRIEGTVTPLSTQENEDYFHSRPVPSRIGAIASQQSQPILDRTTLDHQYTQAEQQCGNHPPRPSHWGGYRLKPAYIEFWQGRPSRLHDRIVYTTQKDGEWSMQRLQP